MATACAVTLALPVTPLRAEFSDIPYADVDRTSFSPYTPQGTRFLPNPVAARAGRSTAGGSKEMLADADVALPPLPDALKPLGPAKVAPTSIIAELPNPKTSTTENAASKPQAKDETPEAPDIVMETTASTSKPASNAFLDWVRANHDAEELAKQQRKQYGDKPKKKDDSDDGDEDLLLNIRQPYTWNQEAPTTRSGSSVIYTVPSH